MSNSKKYTRMTQAELARATVEFAKEFAGETFGPAPKEARDRWKRATRGRDTARPAGPVRG